MAELVWTPDSGPSRTYMLNPGRNTVGRGPHNDVDIDHESVSNPHCEIVVTAKGILVQDLGSAHGTWVGPTRIDATFLGPGQVLRLGEVRLVYPARPQAAPAAPPARPAQAAAPETFSRCVAGAFSYPFRDGGGLILLVTAAGLLLLNVVARIAGFAPILGLGALAILAVFVNGYLFLYVKQVILASVDGKESPPNWPGIGDGSIIASFFQLFCLCALCFGPAVLWRILGPDPGNGLVAVLLAAAGMIYFPMGQIGLALADTLAGLHPAVILPSILKSPGAYSVSVLMVAASGAVQLGGEAAAEALPIPLLPTFAVQFLSLYLLVFVARVLGIMYRLHRKDLARFHEVV